MDIFVENPRFTPRGGRKKRSFAAAAVAASGTSCHISCAYMGRAIHFVGRAKSGGLKRHAERSNATHFRTKSRHFLGSKVFDLCQRYSEVSIKSLNFKDTRKKKTEHASYGPRKKKKKFLTFGKARRKQICDLGPMLGQHRLD